MAGKWVASSRLWREVHPERVKARDARSIAKRTPADYAKIVAWQKDHPELMAMAEARAKIKRKAKALARMEAVAGRPKPATCELCGSPIKISFDHNHVTGKFRGWLCHACNAALGFVKDDPIRLQKMIDYLKNDGTVLDPTVEEIRETMLSLENL